MGTTKTPKTEPVAQARQDLEAAQGLLARWEAEHAAAEAELASLQERAGVEVLDDPEAASTLPRDMSQLRDRIDIAERAVAAQGPRVKTAESAYLHAEADVLEQTVAVARGRLGEHQARTNELLALLREHEGAFEPAKGGRRSQRLQAELAQAEIRVEILRRMAAGEDPEAWLQGQVHPSIGTVAGLQPHDLYPSCVWGPEAVVRAPAYAAVVGFARVALTELESGSVHAELEAEIADIREQMALEPDLDLSDAIARREQRLAELGPEAESRRAELAALTGQ